MDYSKCLAVIVTYNNGNKLAKTLASKPSDFPMDILIVTMDQRMIHSLALTKLNIL